MARKWWTLLVVCLAVFMLLLDITVVNVALPKIQEDLHASFSDLQWVVDAYALTLAAMMLTSGSLADRLGRKRIFAIGLLLFTLASVLCGLAQSPVMLNISRGAQGIGGAVLFAVSLALLAQEFHGRERATAFAFWGATTGAAVAVGPLVGGALTDWLGWRSIFFLNVPIGAFAILATVRYVNESRDPGARGIDWAGTVTFTGSLFALVLALIRGNAEGWGSTLIVTLFAVSVVLALGFVFVESRVSNPMFDLGLFRKPAFDGANIVAFVLSASMFSMFLYLTLYIQTILGFSPLEAGVRFLPITIVSFVVAATSGRLTEHVPVRALMGVGLTLIGVGLLLMRGLDASTTWTHLLAGFILCGAGIGMLNPAIATTSIGVVPPQRSGMGSGINNTFRQVGIATGIAALGAIFQSQIRDTVAAAPFVRAHHLPVDALSKAIAGGGAQTVIDNAGRAGRAPATLAVHTAFANALNHILLVGAVLAFAGAVLGAVLVRKRDFVRSGGPEPAPAAA
jgi:EmrB/QacA subfamily drug resistance transporter